MKRFTLFSVMVLLTAIAILFALPPLDAVAGVIPTAPAACASCHAVAENTLGGMSLIPLFAGAVVNQSTLTTLGRSFSAIFKGAFDSTETKIMALATVVKSTSKIEEYGWLKGLSGLRKWLGDRQVQRVAVSGFRIKNEKYEESVAVGRDDIEDDNLGIYEPLVQSLATDGAQHPGDLLIDLLQSGETELCYDGTEFFGTAHDNGDAGTYINLFTNKALTSVNYEAVRVAMMSLTNEEGKVMGIVPTHLIVPPQLEKIALEIVKAVTIATGGANVYAGIAEVIVEPKLANKPTEWYVAALNRPLKPFIQQTRRALELKSLTDLTDANVFFKDEYVYGVDYRGAVGFGLPQLIAKARA